MRLRNKTVGDPSPGHGTSITLNLGSEERQNNISISTDEHGQLIIKVPCATPTRTCTLDLPHLPTSTSATSPPVLPAVTPGRARVSEVYSDDSDASSADSVKELQDGIDRLASELKERKALLKRKLKEKKRKTPQAASTPGSGVKRGRGRPRKYPLPEPSTSAGPSRVTSHTPHRSSSSGRFYIPEPEQISLQKSPGEPRPPPVTDTPPPSVEEEVDALQIVEEPVYEEGEYYEQPMEHVAETASYEVVAEVAGQDVSEQNTSTSDRDVPIPTISWDTGNARPSLPHNESDLSDVERAVHELQGCDLSAWSDSSHTSRTPQKKPPSPSSDLIPGSVGNSPFKEPLSRTLTDVKKTKWKAKHDKHRKLAEMAISTYCRANAPADEDLLMVADPELLPEDQSPSQRRLPSRNVFEDVHSRPCPINAATLPQTPSRSISSETAEISVLSIEGSPRKSAMKQKNIKSYVGKFFVTRPSPVPKPVPVSTAPAEEGSPDLFGADPASDLEIHQFEERTTLNRENSKSSDNGYSSGSQRVDSSPRLQVQGAEVAPRLASPAESSDEEVPVNNVTIHDSDSDDLFHAKRKVVSRSALSPASQEPSSKVIQKLKDAALSTPRKKFRKKVSPMSKLRRRSVSSDSDSDVRSVRSAASSSSKVKKAAKSLNSVSNKTLVEGVRSLKTSARSPLSNSNSNDASAAIETVTLVEKIDENIPEECHVAIENVKEGDVPKEQATVNTSGESEVIESAIVESSSEEETELGKANKLIAARDAERRKELESRIVQESEPPNLPKDDDTDDSSVSARDSEPESEVNSVNIVYDSKSIQNNCSLALSPNEMESVRNNYVLKSPVSCVSVVEVMDNSSYYAYESETELDRAKRLIAERDASIKAEEEKRKREQMESSDESDDEDVPPQPKKRPKNDSESESTDQEVEFLKTKAQPPPPEISSSSEEFSDDDVALDEKDKSTTCNPRPQAVKSSSSQYDTSSDEEEVEKPTTCNPRPQAVKSSSSQYDTSSDEEEVEKPTTCNPRPQAVKSSSSQSATSSDEEEEVEKSESSQPTSVYNELHKEEMLSDFKEDEDDDELIVTLPDNLDTFSQRNDQAFGYYANPGFSESSKQKKTESAGTPKTPGRRPKRSSIVPEPLEDVALTPGKRTRRSSIAPEPAEDVPVTPSRRTRRGSILPEETERAATPTLRKRAGKSPSKEVPNTPTRRSARISVIRASSEEREIASPVKKPVRGARKSLLPVQESPEDLAEDSVVPNVPSTTEGSAKKSSKNKRKSLERIHEVAQPEPEKAKDGGAGEENSSKADKKSSKHETPVKGDDGIPESKASSKKKSKKARLSANLLDDGSSVFENAPNEDAVMEGDGEVGDKKSNHETPVKGDDGIPESKASSKKKSKKTRLSASLLDNGSLVFENVPANEDAVMEGDGEVGVKKSNRETPVKGDDGIPESKASSKKKSKKARLSASLLDNGSSVFENAPANENGSQEDNDVPASKLSYNTHKTATINQDDTSNYDDETRETEASNKRKSKKAKLNVSISLSDMDIEASAEVPASAEKDKSGKKLSPMVMIEKLSDASPIQKDKKRKTDDDVALEDTFAEIERISKKEKKKKKGLESSVLANLSVEVSPLPEHFLKDLAEVKPHSKIRQGIDLSQETDMSQTTKQDKDKKKKKDRREKTEAGFLSIPTPSMTRFGAVSLSSMMPGREQAAASFKHERLFGPSAHRQSAKKMLSILKKQNASKLA